jgi:hypothetical protein
VVQDSFYAGVGGVPPGIVCRWYGLGVVVNQFAFIKEKFTGEVRSVKMSCKHSTLGSYVLHSVVVLRVFKILKGVLDAELLRVALTGV